MGEVILDFKLNGNPAATPKNAEEIKLISNWSDNTDEDNSEAEVSTNSLQFVLDDATKINDYVAGGINGTTPGIFEGMPYEIALKDLVDSTTQTILDGYLDLAEESTFISCDEVESRIKKRDNLDWLTTTADGFSFAFLAGLTAGTIGKINESDYEAIEYVLNFRPDSTVLATLSVSLVLMGKEGAEALYRLAEQIGDVLETTIPPDPGDLAAAIAKTAAYAAYITVIIAGFIGLIEELIDQVFPPVRRYKGMRVRTMFIRGCNYMGLSFKSTIFDDIKWKQLTYIPTKEKAGKTNGGVFLNNLETGHPNQQSAIYNFGDFLRVMKQMFNAQIKIVGKTLVFERRDFWERKATYTIPDVETDQDSVGRVSSFKYNTNEALSNTLISFSTDPADKNTLENFNGTNIQAIMQPKTVNTPDFVNMGGLAEIRVPFALASRKEGLTKVERLLKEIGGACDAITFTFNLVISAVTLGFGGNILPTTNFSAQIQRRDKMMVLSEDVIGVDKMVVLDTSNRITDNQLVFQGDQGSINLARAFSYGATTPNAASNFTGNIRRLNATDLYFGFHFIDSFAEQEDFLNNIQSVHNQYKLYEGVEIPFCKDDWNALQLNNRFNTADGKIGEMLRIEWDIHNQKAIVDYKVKELYTKNIKLVANAGR